MEFDAELPPPRIVPMKPPVANAQVQSLESWTNTLVAQPVTAYESSHSPNLEKIPITFDSVADYASTFMPFVNEELRVAIVDAIRTVCVRPESISIPLQSVSVSPDGGIQVAIAGRHVLGKALEEREIRYGDLMVISSSPNGVFDAVNGTCV
jgi:hypothetical protein